MLSMLQSLRHSAAGVVQIAGSGLGGGGFALINDGDETTVVDFRERAPKRLIETCMLKVLWRKRHGMVD